MTASGEASSMIPDVRGLSHEHMIVASTISDHDLASQLLLPAKRAGQFIRGDALGDGSETTSYETTHTALTDLMTGGTQGPETFPEQARAQRITFALRILRQAGFAAELSPLSREQRGGTHGE